MGSEMFLQEQCACLWLARRQAKVDKLEATTRNNLEALGCGE